VPTMRRKVRSFTYRQRLSETIGSLETEIRAEVMARGGEAIIDGIRFWIKDGRLFWQALPLIDSSQLAFPFMAEGKGETLG